MTLLRRSSLYRTEPWGVANVPWFVNAVAEIKCNIGARDLLNALHAIEGEMGRDPSPQTGEARIIDLDILLLGQMVVSGAYLTIPHPRLHRRRFVLVPLNELASYVIHPAFGVSVHGLLERLDDTAVVERIVPEGEPARC